MIVLLKLSQKWKLRKKHEKVKKWNRKKRKSGVSERKKIFNEWSKRHLYVRYRVAQKKTIYHWSIKKTKHTKKKNLLPSIKLLIIYFVKQELEDIEISFSPPSTSRITFFIKSQNTSEKRGELENAVFQTFLLFLFLIVQNNATTSPLLITDYTKKILLRGKLQLVWTLYPPSSHFFLYPRKKEKAFFPWRGRKTRHGQFVPSSWFSFQTKHKNVLQVVLFFIFSKKKKCFVYFVLFVWRQFAFLYTFFLCGFHLKLLILKIQTKKDLKHSAGLKAINKINFETSNNIDFSVLSLLVIYSSFAKWIFFKKRVETSKWETQRNAAKNH